MTWQKVVERKGQSVLISSYFYNGIQTKYFKELLDFQYGLDKYLIIDYVNYYDKEEIERFKKEVGKLLEKTQFLFLKKALTIFYKKGKEFIALSEGIEKLKEKELKEEMADLFLQFSEVALSFGPSMYFPILVEERVEEEIRMICQKYNLNEKKDYELFTSCSKATEGTKELMSLYKIAKLVKEQENKRDINKAITDHLAQFGWLSYVKFVGEPWTEEFILNRAQEINRRIKEMGGKRKGLERKYKENKKETKAIIKKYNIQKKDEQIIWLAKELVYFRTWRIDLYSEAGYNIKRLLEVMAKSMNITAEDIVFLTYKEILELLEAKQQADKNIINERKYNRWQLKFTNGIMEFSYGNFENPEKEIDNASELKGRCAYPGKIQGTVKIIRGTMEFSKMEQDMILVTSMTTPDFVPIMEKSKAIITNEGGITCHAAIVSRELKVPCIIGTKIATKVLKDGDIVEVDAEKGIVKKLP